MFEAVFLPADVFCNVQAESKSHGHLIHLVILRFKKGTKPELIARWQKEIYALQHVCQGNFVFLFCPTLHILCLKALSPWRSASTTAPFMRAMQTDQTCVYCWLAVFDYIWRMQGFTHTLTAVFSSAKALQDYMVNKASVICCSR